MADIPTKIRELARQLGLAEAEVLELDALLARRRDPEHAQATVTGTLAVAGAGIVPLAEASTQSGSEPPPPGPALAEPEAGEPWGRYEDVGLIGRGGMGEVRRVRDRVMGRALAMKLLPADYADSSAARERFLAEVRLTASLQHPGIVPVHDCGALPDGRLWFTMKEVRGSTLRKAISELHAVEEPPSGSYDPPQPRARLTPSLLRPLVDAFLRVCEAVAYAHGQGILHRDLKPDNVMIGELGEVLVMDWGLARPVGQGSSEAVIELRSAAGPHMTQAGQVVGTPAYMAPEQARGERARVGPPSDVYALGVILYEILCGRPPYAGSARAVWAQVIHDAPEPISLRGRGQLPPDLVAVCERAMAREPGDRFPDARALAEELRGVLAGARRRDRAMLLVGEAQALAPKAAALRDRARALEAEARSLLARLQTFDPADEKVPGWALEDEARSLDRAATLEEVAWRLKLDAALNESPDLPEAHEALADAHLGELVAAEAARDLEGATRAEALLRLHDRGRHAAVLRGDGALTLHTDVEGAEVWLDRYVERRRRLHADPEGLLGYTPLDGVTLPRGSYLLRVRSPGRRELRYPVFIRRGEHWNGVRPGSLSPSPVPLLAEEALRDDDVHVPAGWFISGGDPAAGESLPLRRLWVDGFVLRRHPVTQAEYLAFLNDLVARGREADAAAACPRVPSAVAGSVDIPLFGRGREGRFEPGPHAPADHARYPVVSVDWYSAKAFAAWYAARTGEPWRLPGELEWEKAARGADGRSLPWGEQLEPTWACMVGSRPGAPSLSPVEAYPIDEGPTGVRGLAGNARDWCIETWRADGPRVENEIVCIVPADDGDPELRSVRGGAWPAPAPLCRSATRIAAGPSERLAGLGIRLARSL